MRGLSDGLSFLEVMVSVFILSVAFLYIVPVFLIAPQYRFQESQTLRSSLFAESVMETFRQWCRLYVNNPNTDFYTNIDTIYNPNTIGNCQQQFYFVGTPYDRCASYIVAYPEDPISLSKRLVVHLEWNVAQGSNSQRETYTASALVARDKAYFPFNPQIILASTTSTRASTSMSTTYSGGSSTTTYSGGNSTTTSTSSTSTSTTYEGQY